jgi:hypothetical protein
MPVSTPVALLEIDLFEISIFHSPIFFLSLRDFANADPVLLIQIRITGRIL